MHLVVLAKWARRKLFHASILWNVVALFPSSRIIRCPKSYVQVRQRSPQFSCRPHFGSREFFPLRSLALMAQFKWKYSLALRFQSLLITNAKSSERASCSNLLENEFTKQSNYVGKAVSIAVLRSKQNLRVVPQGQVATMHVKKWKLWNL